MRVKSVPVGSLVPHPRNVNEGDVGAIVTSIKADGFLVPLIVQTDTPDGEERNVILAGKHRWLAAKELGMKTIPVVPVTVDDTEAVRIMLNDNRARDLGRNDDEALALLLQELGNTGSLDGLLYDGDSIDELLRDTGLLGEQQSSFLDGYIASKPQYGPADAPTAAGEWVTISFTMLPADRDAFAEALKVAQQHYEVPTQPQALLQMARGWLEAQREAAAAD